jgi:DNA-binding IclR family transcriptional regulator
MTNRTCVACVEVAEPPRSSGYRIQVLDRTLRILDALAETETNLGLADLARRLALHKATAHRLLRVLELRGLVRRDPLSGKYKLGVKLFELGNRAIEQVDLRDSAEPFLRNLVKETRETAHISIPDGSHMVSIAKVEAPWAMRSPSTLGRRTPVHCSSSGKVVLAFLPQDALKELIRQLRLIAFTQNTLTTRASLLAEIQHIRERGFAIDNEEGEVGLRCIGAPLFNHTGRVCAAISVAGPAFRLTDQRLPGIGRIVADAARALSKALGYQPPTPGVPGRCDMRVLLERADRSRDRPLVSRAVRHKPRPMPRASS